MEKILDCKGMNCPLPVVNAKKAAEELQADDVLTVLVDNEIAVQNLTRFAEHKGFNASAEKKADKEYAVFMTISGAAAEETRDEEIACVIDSRRKGMLVVLSANVMGTGDPKLGTSLMKAFVFALTKQDQLPDTIPEKLRKQAGDYGLQLLPCRDGVEGFFVARMKRIG